MTETQTAQPTSGRRWLPAAGWVAVGIAAAAFSWATAAVAQRAGRPSPAATGEAGTALWTQATPLEDGRQMLVVVDQQARTLAIYHVDPAAGTLTLKSSRDIRWDLMVEDFNAQEPRPAALRKMLEMPK